MHPGVRCWSRLGCGDRSGQAGRVMQEVWAVPVPKVRLFEPAPTLGSCCTHLLGLCLWAWGRFERGLQQRDTLTGTKPPPRLLRLAKTPYAVTICRHRCCLRVRYGPSGVIPAPAAVHCRGRPAPGGRAVIGASTHTHAVRRQNGPPLRYFGCNTAHVTPAGCPGAGLLTPRSFPAQFSLPPTKKAFWD